MNYEKVLNRTEFYKEVRDVLYNEKAQSSVRGLLVSVNDVLNFLIDMGFDDALLTVFEEDQLPSDDEEYEISSCDEDSNSDTE